MTTERLDTNNTDFSTRVEAELIDSQYHLVPIGGRIKAAGVSFAPLYELVESLNTSPSSESVVKANKALGKIRKNPPLEIRKSFFPIPRDQVKALTKMTPSLLRPIIKTDQGPAGNFLGMRIAEDGIIEPINVESHGLAVPEIFFLSQLEELGLINEFVSAINEVITLFASEDEHEAMLAVERLQIASEERGITSLRRDASVGREPFFFIRPARGEKLITVPTELAQRIENAVINKVQKIEELAKKTESFLSKGLSLNESIAKARSDETQPQITSEITHFQADIIAKADGSFVIDAVHFPDVGLFLGEIDSEDQFFHEVQEIVTELKPEVVNSIMGRLRELGASRVNIITRDSVLSQNEDMLEMLEIKALRESLDERGVETELIGISSVTSISKGEVVLPLNLDINSPDYMSLLERVAAKELLATTNPFIRLFEGEASTVDTHELSGTNLKNFLEIFAELKSTPTEALMQFFSSQQILTSIGVDPESDFFYFSDGHNKDIPAFRYDIRSLQIVAKLISESEGSSDCIKVRSLQFKPEDAIILREDGPRLAAFRFMFTKGGVNERLQPDSHKTAST